MDKTLGHKIWDSLQIILILILLIVCFVTLKKNNDLSNNVEFKMAHTYTKIYDSQKIESLKKENKALYDSIKHLKDVESALLLKYKKNFKSDTVKVTEYIVKYISNDSVYSYSQNTDTISYNLDVCASNLKWHKLDFTLNDDLIIVTREKENKVETTVGTNVGEIESSTMWKKKKNILKEKIAIGPQVTFGYNFSEKKPEIILGLGITYDLW